MTELKDKYYPSLGKYYPSLGAAVERTLVTMVDLLYTFHCHGVFCRDVLKMTLFSKN